MTTLRNWLKSIVREAIREEYPVHETCEEPEATLPSGESISVEELRRLMNNSNPLFAKKTEHYPDAFTPMSFEQEQDQAIRAQDAFWKKQVPSDL
jgi:hypothetical protein